MLIWLASYPRSGNHLLRAILSRCFELGSYEIYQNIGGRSDPALAGVIKARTFDDKSGDTFVARARVSNECILVKTHDLVPGTDRCIYIVRDGRAALASYQRYLADVDNCYRTLPELIEGSVWPGKWSEHVEQFLSRDSATTLVLRFEDLASANPPLEQIAAFLGVRVRRRFDLAFSELHKLSPSIFPTGNNGPGVEIVERESSAPFWRFCGPTMRRLGYAKLPRAIADPPKVFFFHLPKCGGTSVWALLRELVGSESVYQAYDVERAQQFATMDPVTRSAFRAIGGHFSLGDYRTHLDLSRYFSITTFRDPVQRVCSEYYYAASNPRHSHHAAIAQLSLREFIGRNPNPMTRLLCGHADAEMAAVVVREVFDDWAFVDDDMNRLAASVCRYLGALPRRLPFLNVGPRTNHAILVDDEHRALIHKVHGADVELCRLLRSDRRVRVAPIARTVPLAADPTGPPVFHVVTPTYNAVAYLDEAISSIVGQEGQFRIHYHVQDGGSDDGTVEAARRWQERIASGAFKPRCLEVVMSVDSRPDNGMYDAIAAGFRELAPHKADFATWLNGDDRLAPGAMRVVAEAFRDLPAVELIGGRKAVIDGRGEPLVSGDLILYPQRCIAAGLHDGRRLPFVMQEGTFWRTSLWQRTGGIDATFRFAGDWDLWKRFAAVTQYVTLDAVTGYHRRRPGQLTEDLAAYYREIDEHIGTSAPDSDRIFREYNDAWRPNQYLTVELFPARMAQRTGTGRWALVEWQLPMPRGRNLLPIDGDWIVVAGFDDVEGPFPNKGITQPFHWATSQPAVLKVYSAHSGVRTLSLRLGGAVRGQRVGVRFDSGRVSHRKIRRTAPKLGLLTFRLDVGVGPVAVELTIDQWMTTPEGRRLGLMLGSMELTDEAPRIPWLKRLLPPALHDQP